MKKILISICIILVLAAAGGLILIQSKRVTAGSAYLPDSEMMNRLAQAPLTQNGNEFKFGDARMMHRNGNNLLFLKGGPYEIGFQHGKLLKENIAVSTVPVFGDPLSSIPKFRKLPGWIKKIMLIYLEMSIYGPIERNTPLEYLEELKGIADGAGMDYRTIFIANFLSDMNMAMIANQITTAARDFGFTTECTSFVASGPATEGGKLIFGRNTDYSAQQRWVKNQTVFFYEPKDGFRYVKVSTAGLLKCNSAMNENGIVVGGHFMGFTGADAAGVSFTIFENQIMRTAENIDDALTLLKNQPRGGAFGLMIADGKSGKAVAVEATRAAMGVRQMKRSTIALTNCSFTPELKEADLLITYNLAMRNVLGRHERVMDLINENYGQITPAMAAEFMGDHMDQITGKERGTGATLCFEGNVTSVVFQPETGFFWVATGSEPACTNPYIGFDFNAAFQKTPPSVRPLSLAGYQWKDDTVLKGLKAYMKAVAAYKEDPDNRKAILAHMKEATDAAPEEPLYARILARIMIYEKAYVHAAAASEYSLSFDQAPNEKALAMLLSGQAYDLMGKRNKAKKRYQGILGLWKQYGSDPLMGINQMVYGFAVKYLGTPFTRDDIDGFDILDGGLD
jgi:isopenicillin-N N-acyltransferase-like protein